MRTLDNEASLIAEHITLLRRPFYVKEKEKYPQDLAVNICFSKKRCAKYELILDFCAILTFNTSILSYEF
jgi:hypothetical protein